MTTLGTAPTVSSSSFVIPSAARGHARTHADQQPIRRAALLAVIDGLIALVAMTAVVIASNRSAMPQGLDSLLSMRVTLKNVLLVVLVLAEWHLVFRACGLYTVRGVRNHDSELLRVALACAIGSAFAVIIPLTSMGAVRPVHLLYFYGTALVLALVVRSVRWTLAHSGRPRKVLIVGTGVRALALWHQMQAESAGRYDLAGFLDTADGVPASSDIARQCLGTLERLEPVLMQHVIDEVCIALPIKSHYREIQETLLSCERVGVRAKYQASLFATQVAWARYADDPSNLTVAMDVVPDDYRLIIKRVLDLVGATTALIVLAPVMLLIAAAIKLTSPGPVFFAQERYGLNRRRFRMFKFRTMRMDAEQLQAALEALNEADGPVFKITNDPRITPLGRFLRRSSLDELPQLLNVIRGEMSLVGPRPLPLRDVLRFTSPSDMRRFSVRPGLTCLWQISGRCNLSFTDWIRLDLKYIDGWSLALDLSILVRTLPAVLRGNGAR
jgi:exopolysaccharide biosynthesis polyprenyl glycosylphosphotransferase